jgi:Rrf2 family protein
LLEGTRGKSGGFQMTRPAKAVSLAEVIAPFEPITANRKSCPFGNKTCSDKDPCAAHDRWKEVNAVLTRFLDETTLQDVAARASDGSRVDRKK